MHHIAIRLVAHFNGATKSSRLLPIELEKAKHLVFEKYLKDEIKLTEKNDFNQRTDLEIANLRTGVASLTEKAGNKQEVIDHAFSFLGNTASYWQYATIDTQMKFQSLLFPEGIQYSLKTKEFRTAKISELYRLVSIKKDPTIADESLLVTARGILKVYRRRGQKN